MDFDAGADAADGGGAQVEQAGRAVAEQDVGVLEDLGIQHWFFARLQAQFGLNQGRGAEGLVVAVSAAETEDGLAAVVDRHCPGSNLEPPRLDADGWGASGGDLGGEVGGQAERGHGSTVEDPKQRGAAEQAIGVRFVADIGQEGCVGGDLGDGEGGSGHHSLPRPVAVEPALESGERRAQGKGVSGPVGGSAGLGAQSEGADKAPGSAYGLTQCQVICGLVAGRFAQ